MKKSFSVLLMVVSFASFGQKGINGKFVFAPGLGETVLILNDKFQYRAYQVTCTDESTDTGRYNLDHDTILFHTYYSKNDFEESRPAKLDLNTEPNPKHSSDSIMLLAKNRTPYVLYNISVMLNGKEVLHIDSLVESYSAIIHIKNISADSSVVIAVKWDSLLQSRITQAPAFIFFNFNIDQSIRGYKSAFTSKLLYKDDSFYFLDEYNKTYTVCGIHGIQDAALKREKKKVR